MAVANLEIWVIGGQETTTVVFSCQFSNLLWFSKIFVSLIPSANESHVIRNLQLKESTQRKYMQEFIIRKTSLLYSNTDATFVFLQDKEANAY